MAATQFPGLTPSSNQRRFHLRLITICQTGNLCLDFFSRFRLSAIEDYPVSRSYVLIKVEICQTTQLYSHLFTFSSFSYFDFTAQSSQGRFLRGSLTDGWDGGLKGNLTSIFYSFQWIFNIYSFNRFDKISQRCVNAEHLPVLVCQGRIFASTGVSV